MNTQLNRRAFLMATSGALTFPMLSFGSILAFAANDELIVRVDTDIGNLDPANRVLFCKSPGPGCAGQRVLDDGALATQGLRACNGDPDGSRRASWRAC